MGGGHRFTNARRRRWKPAVIATGAPVPSPGRRRKVRPALRYICVRSSRISLFITPVAPTAFQ